MNLQPTTLLHPTTVTLDEVAVRDPDRCIDWATLEERARRFAQGLHAAGLDDLMTWAMLAPNRVEWAEAALGNVRAGGRCVPLNWHLSVPELAAMVRDSGIRLIITDPAYADAACDAADVAVAPGEQPVRVIMLGDEYEGWLSQHPDTPLEEGPAGVVLQYTGGTTGPSRAVMRSDATGPVNGFVTRQSVWANLTGMPKTGASLLVTPAYHALGGALLRSSLARGVPITMLPRWDPDEMLRIIEQRRITTTAMVPTQFVRLLKLDPAERAAADVSSLRWVLHTAAPCPEWAKRAMIDWFGPVIVELYGSSEGAGPVVCTSDEWLQRPGTVGRAVGSLRLSIVGDNGNDLPPGEVGTIYAQRADGPPSYHGDDDKSNSIRLADGRFTVGDIGWLDDDGYLFLADRRVDLVIRGGTNIYPAEIEAALSEHPAVADVAVFGVPDPEWGQRIVALVEPVADVASSDPIQPSIAAELLEHCRARLAAFKVPQVLELVPSLPRESSGKLKKRLLREDYLSRLC